MASESDSTNTDSEENAFNHAYAEWAAGLSAYRAATDANDGKLLTDLLNTISDLFDKMIVIPAPTPGALFLKLEAIGQVPWTDPGDEAGAHLARLTADAGNIATQAAKAWLGRWRALGGTVTRNLEHPERVWIGHPSYSLSPIAAEDEATMEEGGMKGAALEESRGWRGAFYDGRARELSDLLDDTPGLLDGVKAIVFTDPTQGLQSGGRK